ncbi:alpha-amylase family glycosyl hydrolase [Psychroserpens sp.]|uniref:alpha-amylase family glycosyl hydrolase n=1 Tax=Psychroserpens sp. TaxID=2020870 RepID=UPI003C788CFD
MKRLIPILISLLSLNAFAQISLSVGAIEIDQPVTITVDINNTTDTNCNGLNNPNKVYMHSGIGNNSNAFGFNVIGNFGDDDGIGQMTDNGDGTYSITITPEIYYELTPAQADAATQIGIVFRNEDGSQELKDDGCADFILPIGSVLINLTQPTGDTIVVNSGDNVSLSATIIFQGSATVQGTFEVFYNDVSIITGSCGFPNCNTTISNITESGTVKFVGTPPGSSETGQATFDIIVAPTVIEEAIPSGIEDGITYGADATRATLAVTAPGKEFIQIAGSFNNYAPTNADVMKRDPATGRYWLELTGLTPGQVETYQYWVFDTNPIMNSPALVKTADPYSTLVLSPFDDPFIPSNSFSGLGAGEAYEYPAGQEREVTVLQTGQTPYPWQVPNFQKAKKEDLIIYEVLVRDFDANRNYQDLIDRIDYFKNLNINAIHLMPVMEYEGNESWGYNTSFHMALDKFYGSPDKLKEFIDLCHQNDIAIILDVVLNHAFGRNPMVRMWMDDPDGDGWGGPAADSPYFNQFPTHSFNVGNDFNHQQPLVQEYTRRVIKQWVEEYNIDGFRWDLTKGFTQNCGNGTFDGNFGCTNEYQQDRIDVLRTYADYSWSLDNTHYVIFEHLGNDNEEQQWANYRLDDPVSKGIMMWGKMTDQYSQLTMGYNSDNNINRIGHQSRGFNAPRLLGYPESHDEERLMYRNVEFGNDTNGSHNVRDLNTALSRMSALGAVSLTIPGPKMIWHFGELGMDNSIFTCNDGTVENDGCKLDTKPQPQWVENWLGDTNRNQIYTDWARLNALKINEAVFEGDYTITSGNLTPRIDIFDTSIPSTSLRNVIVLANFDLVTRNLSTNFPTGGTWFDLMDNTGNTTFSGTNVNIPAGQFRIFGNQPATLSTESLNAERTFRIYPNPVNDTFETNKVLKSLQIFDITGKLVKSFDEGYTETDSYDISDLTPSIYLVKIENSNGETSTSKLIKL